MGTEMDGNRDERRGVWMGGKRDRQGVDGGNWECKWV